MPRVTEVLQKPRPRRHRVSGVGPFAIHWNASELSRRCGHDWALPITAAEYCRYAIGYGRSFGHRSIRLELWHAVTAEPPLSCSLTFQSKRMTESADHQRQRSGLEDSATGHRPPKLPVVRADARFIGGPQNSADPEFVPTGAHAPITIGYVERNPGEHQLTSHDEWKGYVGNKGTTRIRGDDQR